MAESASNKFRDKIIARISDDSNVLSLPQSLYQILNEVDKENFSPQKLAEIIKTDPALTARILSLANSTFYQRFSRTTTVNQAVSVLGISTVKCLALSTTVLKPELIEKNSGINPKEFFTYVLLNAATAECLARELKLKASEEMFIIGLLNDIGLIFLVHHYPSEYRQVLSLKGKVDSLRLAEIEILGIDHYEISHLLAKKWHLPEEMADSIGCQTIENSSEKVKKMQATINLARLMIPNNFSGFDLALEDRLTEVNKAADNLSLTRNQLDSVTSKLMSSTIEAAEHLGVDIGSIEAMNLDDRISERISKMDKEQKWFVWANKEQVTSG